MWKHYWQSKLIFIFLLGLFLAPQVVFAGNMCYCFWENSSQHFDTSCLPQVLPDPATSEACADTCVSMVGLDFFKGTEFTTDTSSEQGQALTERCEEMIAASYTNPNAETKNTTGRTPVDAVKPELAVKISSVIFSDLYEEGGQIRVTWLGEYIQGVYTYLLGGALAIAIVLVMVRGLQYVLAAGGAANTQKAIDGIKAAAVGLVLLLSVSAILYVVNPQLLNLDSIVLDTVKYRELALSTIGPGGKGGVSTLISDLPYPYDSIYQQANSEGQCGMGSGEYFLPPVDDLGPFGGGPNYGEHHWFDYGANGDWRKINNMDWGKPFGANIYASFSGNVSYIEGTGDACGNKILLESSTASIGICHAKDFTDENGNYLGPRAVKAGDVIGHVGGVCCIGQTPVGTADCANAAKLYPNQYTEMCTDVYANENCSCQTSIESGNTTGPHVHVTWYNQSDNHAFLACIQDQSTIGDAGSILRVRTSSGTMSSAEAPEETTASSSTPCEEQYVTEEEFRSCCTTDGSACYDETGAFEL